MSFLLFPCVYGLSFPVTHLKKKTKKKSKSPTHFHTKFSESPDSEWRSSFTFARFQSKCASYTVLLYQKNLHSLKSKSHSIFLSILHVPFGYVTAVKLEMYGLNLAALCARWGFLACALLKFSLLVSKILKTIINILKFSLKGLF